MKEYYGISGTTPWEFNPELPARSLSVLFLYYGPLFRVMKDILQLSDPLVILRVVRLYNALLYLFVVNYTISKLVSKSRKDVVMLIVSSYITWAYQSHSFTNSTETILLLLVLSTLQEIYDGSTNILKVSICGVLIAIGTFTRITFPAFLLLPGVKVFGSFQVQRLKWLVVLTLTMIPTALFIINADTKYFNSNETVIAPLNNLLYNLDSSNLELHGLHPRYTHLLVNIPVMIGPGLIPLLMSKKSLFSITNLSIISALVSLSIMPHQELRFLIPILPLLLMNFNFSKIRFVSSSILLKLWFIFNAIMLVFLGVLHQGGIIPVLADLHSSKLDVDIWWKTYSPPTWMYMNNELTVSTTTIRNETEYIDDIDFTVIKDHVIDLKGCDFDLLKETFEKFQQNNVKQIRLIYPLSMLNNDEFFKYLGELGQKYNASYLFDGGYHLDLDHLDFSGRGLLGMGAIQVTLL